MQSAVTSVRIIQFQWHFIRGKNTILIIEAKTFSEPCSNLHNKSNSPNVARAGLTFKYSSLFRFVCQPVTFSQPPFPSQLPLQPGAARHLKVFFFIFRCGAKLSRRLSNGLEKKVQRQASATHRRLLPLSCNFYYLRYISRAWHT